MAEAAIILGLGDAAAGLVIKYAQVVKFLHDLRGRYKAADLEFNVLAEQIETIGMAWSKIEDWCEAKKQLTDPDHDGDDLLYQLGRKLECGSLVVSALANDLEQVVSAESPVRLNFKQRSKLLWNEASIEAHRSRLRDQVVTMTLLLQIIELPTPAQRDQLITNSIQRMAKSDESALSIVPSSWSYASRHGSCVSLESAKLEYIPFAFEDTLFTARVYKRNYRNNTANVGEVSEICS